MFWSIAQRYSNTQLKQGTVFWSMQVWANLFLALWPFLQGPRTQSTTPTQQLQQLQQLQHCLRQRHGDIPMLFAQAVLELWELLC